MPIISVIIPAYNAENTIRETIDSVIRQRFTDWELIVINDGSTDATLEVLSEIEDPRLKVFSYANTGVAATRNRGMTHATGDYISFLDADDLWTTDKLETQLKVLQNNPQAAVAYSWTDYIDESGRVLGPCAHAELSGDVYKILLLADFIGSGSNPLVKAEALAEVGEFNPDFVPNEDWDIWLRLAERYHFAVVPSVQVLYRQVTGSGSYNMRKMEVASVRVLDRVFKEAPESIQSLKSVCWANRYKCFAWKALEGTPERQRALMGAKFIYHALAHDPSLWRQRVIWKIWLKVALSLLLPTQTASALFQKMGRWSNIDALQKSLQYPVSH